MSIPEITQKLLTAKENKGLTFADLAEVLQCNEVWIASVIARAIAVLAKCRDWAYSQAVLGQSLQKQ